MLTTAAGIGLDEHPVEGVVDKPDAFRAVREVLLTFGADHSIGDFSKGRGALSIR